MSWTPTKTPLNLILHIGPCEGLLHPTNEVSGRNHHVLRTSAITIFGMTSGRPQFELGIIKAPPRGRRTVRVWTSWQINLYCLAHRRAGALGRHNPNTGEKSFTECHRWKFVPQVEVLRQFSGRDVLMRLVKGRGIELYIAV